MKVLENMGKLQIINILKKINNIKPEMDEDSEC